MKEVCSNGARYYTPRYFSSNTTLPFVGGAGVTAIHTVTCLRQHQGGVFPELDFVETHRLLEAAIPICRIPIQPEVRVVMEHATKHGFAVLSILARVQDVTMPEGVDRRVGNVPVVGVQNVESEKPLVPRFGGVRLLLRPAPPLR